MLRYLSGTQRGGIVIRPVSQFIITGFCDADWAGDTSDRRSQSGFLIYLGETLVAWSSRKQETVAWSSIEAEYRAVTTTVTNLDWVRNMMIELGVEVPNPMVVNSDNKGATFLATNQICHSKLKHIAIDVDFVKERVEQGVIRVCHILGKDEKADILTKALQPKAFLEQRNNLEVLPQD